VFKTLNVFWQRDLKERHSKEKEKSKIKDKDNESYLTPLRECSVIPKGLFGYIKPLLDWSGLS
jgi:hypothetical protein